MKPRVLLIEDETDVAAYLAIFLEQQGFEVERAASLADGRQSAARARQDRAHQLILLDVMLQDGTAAELLPDLVQPGAPPVLLVTGLAPEDETLRQCLRLGAAGYLSKTARVDELLAQVRRILKL